jgi:hypothetical protein
VRINGPRRRNSTKNSVYLLCYFTYFEFLLVEAGTKILQWCTRIVLDVDQDS